MDVDSDLDLGLDLFRFIRQKRPPLLHLIPKMMWIELISSDLEENWLLDSQQWPERKKRRKRTSE
jgi:hypothetical protein